MLFEGLNTEGVDMKTLLEVQQSFDLQTAIATDLVGTADRINAYVECCARYVGLNKTALHCISKTGVKQDYTFEQLDELSGKFANVLKKQGIQAGQCVAGLLTRRVELVITILATWRIGAIYQPLFTAFESKAIEHRLKCANTALVLAMEDQVHKLDGLFPDEKIITVFDEPSAEHEHDFWYWLNQESAECEPHYLTFDDDFLMMFTSGTTGLSKPVQVPLKAVLAFKGYLNYAIDLREDDVFWNMADPGWAYGLYYGITGPLAWGRATILNESGFSVENSVDLIREYKVTNLASSPTAYRMFFGHKELFEERAGKSLRVVSSAGEPLTPEVVSWFKNGVGVNIFDHYGQTELGMVVANHHALAHPFKNGSAGLAVPGHRYAVLDEQFNELGEDEAGILAIIIDQSPLYWFKGYLNVEKQPIHGNYYLTGDTVKINEYGGIDFVGRYDDVITTSGYRVGPFDVESTLLECEQVLESAVVGKPDPQKTEIVKAFVVLKAQFKDQANDELKTTLQQYVRHRLSHHAYPKEIEFVDELPKTTSGKIQRNLLKKLEIERASQAS